MRSIFSLALSQAVVCALYLPALCTLLAASAQADVRYTGTNLAGAEFGEANIPGTIDQHYTYPTAEEVDYYVGKGMNIFRIPFRWERLQRSQFSSLHAGELARLESIVRYATGVGACVILDPHNGARYNDQLIGSGAVSNAAFEDFWTRVANVFKDDPRVIMGLMNEPNTMPTEQWFDAAQASILAIRATGAANLILVPGNAWTGAHSWLDNWYGTPNAQVMLQITDPLDNFAFEVHQYLDFDSSGTTDEIVSAQIGRERLEAFTDWARFNDRVAFLGEFAAGNDTIGAGLGDEALAEMLSYMDANDDVWLGWTWWAGGPWWGDDIFTIEPQNLGQANETDRPVMAVVQPFFNACTVLGPWSVYCTSSPNTVSASGAQISTTGSPSVAANDLTLHVADLPLNQFGYFLMSPNAGSTPLTGSAGILCLGGGLIRWNQFQFIRNSGSTGHVLLDMDVNNGPFGLTFQDGDTWNFQYWYRDLPGSSNTSAGYQIAFCD